MANNDIENKWISTDPEIFDEITRAVFAVHRINRADCPDDFEAVKSAVIPLMVKSFTPSLVHDLLAASHHRRKKREKKSNDVEGGECENTVSKSDKHEDSPQYRDLTLLFFEEQERLLERIVCVVWQWYVVEFYGNIPPPGVPEYLNDPEQGAAVKGSLLFPFAKQLAKTFPINWTLKTLFAAHRPKKPRPAGSPRFCDLSRTKCGWNATTRRRPSGIKQKSSK